MLFCGVLEKKINFVWIADPFFFIVVIVKMYFLMQFFCFKYFWKQWLICAAFAFLLPSAFTFISVINASYIMLVKYFQNLFKFAHWADYVFWW